VANLKLILGIIIPLILIFVLILISSWNISISDGKVSLNATITETEETVKSIPYDELFAGPKTINGISGYYQLKNVFLHTITYTNTNIFTEKIKYPFFSLCALVGGKWINRDRDLWLMEGTYNKSGKVTYKSSFFEISAYFSKEEHLLELPENSKTELVIAVHQFADYDKERYKNMTEMVLYELDSRAGYYCGENLVNDLKASYHIKIEK